MPGACAQERRDGALLILDRQRLLARAVQLREQGRRAPECAARRDALVETANGHQETHRPAETVRVVPSPGHRVDSWRVRAGAAFRVSQGDGHLPGGMIDRRESSTNQKSSL